MKVIHNINKWSYGITLVLYITIYLGMIAQIALGSIQVILAIFLLSRYQRLDEKTKRRLLVYGVLTSLYLSIFALWNLLEISNNDVFIITGITVLPMSLATFFVFITHKLRMEEQQSVPKATT
ncbi:MAG: hypothetical protein AAF969_00390 [Bacteroidota bacterium]